MSEEGPGEASTHGGVLEQILDQAEVRPDWPAVKDLNVELTYGQLRRAAGQLAGGLLEQGIREGDRVGLFIPNSVDFVIAALACLWIGSIFIPLPVNDPEARLALILDDCEPAVVLTASSGDDRGIEFPESLHRHPSAEVGDVARSRVPVEPVPFVQDRPAYIIYTSGTTAMPKGVLIGAGAFAWAVRGAVRAVGVHPQTRTLCVSPFYFDGSFATLFPTLVSGGLVVIRPRDALLFPPTFFHAVASEGITYTGFSPSYLRLLLASRHVSTLADSTLEVVALGGEAASTGDVRALWAAAPGVRVFNRYGPTETTIAVTNAELTPAMLAEGSVPIGRPHDGVTFHLIDENGEVIEGAGSVGELYIGGIQLMIGYWRTPELTARVLSDSVIEGHTLYRTGDLVFRDDTGNYVYYDRADRVIKRSGVRISLVELTEVVAQIEGVSSAVCSTFDDEGRLGIVAFVVTDGPWRVADLQGEARRHLSSVMLPNRFEVVESLPLTTSNKIDERKLLAAAGLREAPRAGGASPPPGAR